VQTPKLVKTGGGKVFQILFNIIGGVAVIGMSGVLGYLGYKYMTNDGCLVFGSCADNNAKLGCAPCSELSGDLTTDISDTGDAQVVGACNMSSYQLEINDDGYITVPDCWKVTDFKALYTNLTDAELQDYMQEDHQAGAWPIFDIGAITISDGVSFFTVSREPIFATGGIGGVTPPIPDDAVIIKEPSVDYEWGIENPREAFGIARTLEAGEVYEYHLIFNNTDYNPDGEYEYELNQYFDYMNPMSSASAYFTFVGDEATIPAMDALFEEACWQNTTGLCD